MARACIVGLAASVLAVERRLRQRMFGTKNRCSARRRR